MPRLISTIALISALAAQPAFAQQARPEGAEMQTMVRYGDWGFDISGMDRSVRPGDNFAMYAFGDWYRDAVIPPGQPAVGVRMEVQNRNEQRVRTAIEQSAKIRPRRTSG